jgi:SAM-dependent methyltransferase
LGRARISRTKERTTTAPSPAAPPPSRSHEKKNPEKNPNKNPKHTAVFVSGHAAARLWDAFYKRNAAAFFRDRHYLEREWPRLGRALAVADALVEAAPAAATTPSVEPVTLLEAGCGAGNAVLPLLEAHQPGAVRAYACDFSPAAVELVRSSAVGRAAAEKGLIDLWVADVAGGAEGEGDNTNNNPLIGPGRSPKNGCDFVTYIFVLSALDPERCVRALRNAAAALKPGTGRLLVRDYAAGDLAQARLAGGGSVGAAVAGAGGGAGAVAVATVAATATTATTTTAAGEEKQRLSGRLYVRGDGTCAYYFEPQELADMALRAGLRVAPPDESSTAGGNGSDGGGARIERAACGVELVSRTVVNRASGAVMERRWLQAAFYRPPAEGGEDEGRAAVAEPTTSPQKKRARDEADASSSSAAAAAVALARLRAPYCFRPLAGAGPPAPEFRTIELPSAAAAAPAGATATPPPLLLRWLALKSALPAGGAYASRLEGWAAEVAAALASAAAASRRGGSAGGGVGGGGSSVVVIPCPGDAPSHAAAALLALHAVRVGPEAARRADCAVLSAGRGAAGALLGGGDGDGGGDDDDDGDGAPPAQQEEEDQDQAAPDYEAQREHALRAYRLTLAANAPRAVFERVATWRLAPAPGEGSGREDPYAAGAAAGIGGGIGGSGPFDVAIALPAASPASSPALEDWRRRQQRRVLALAVGSGGNQGDAAACCCVLDFTRR